MVITDMSFSNPLIQGYFDGTSSYVPVAEFMYVHRHIIRPNFLTQIESQILLASAALSEQPKKKGVAIRLEALANQLAEHMNGINEERAAKILPILKEIYELCGRILK